MGFIRKIGNAFARFMYGRNGGDQLGLFMLWVAIMLDIVNIFVKNDVVYGIMKYLSTHYAESISLEELSGILGVNPNTIQKAFGELDRNGIIISGQGRGCFVADNAAEKIKAKLSARITEIESIAVELARAGIEEEKILEAIRRAYHDKKQ